MVDQTIVTNQNGSAVEATDNGDGTRNLKQPSGRVTSEVTLWGNVYETAPAP